MRPKLPIRRERRSRTPSSETRRLPRVAGKELAAQELLWKNECFVVIEEDGQLETLLNSKY